MRKPPPAHQVVFGTSGHRGTSLRNHFNEDHILAICQAIAKERQAQRISGPLYLGMDTHALMGGTELVLTLTTTLAPLDRAAAHTR